MTRLTLAEILANADEIRQQMEDYVPTEADRFQRIDGGVRVHSTEAFHVDVLAMGFGNQRIVTTPVGREDEYTRGWCYQRPLAEVILIALVFYPLDDNSNEPSGWVKEVGTERRACASLYRSQRKEHRGYVAECPDCGDERLI